jgi:hypothetical protein
VIRSAEKTVIADSWTLSDDVAKHLSALRTLADDVGMDADRQGPLGERRSW